MKEGKACGPSGIVIETVKAGDDARSYHRYDQPDN